MIVGVPLPPKEYTRPVSPPSSADWVRQDRHYTPGADSASSSSSSAIPRSASPPAQGIPLTEWHARPSLEFLRATKRSAALWQVAWDTAQEDLRSAETEEEAAEARAELLALSGGDEDFERVVFPSAGGAGAAAFDDASSVVSLASVPEDAAVIALAAAARRPRGLVWTRAEALIKEAWAASVEEGDFEGVARVERMAAGRPVSAPMAAGGDAVSPFLGSATGTEHAETDFDAAGASPASPPARYGAAPWRLGVGSAPAGQRRMAPGALVGFTRGDALLRVAWAAEGIRQHIGGMLPSPATPRAAGGSSGVFVPSTPRAGDASDCSELGAGDEAHAPQQQ